MLLAIDSGNTHVKFAVFDGENLRATWRIRTQAGRTADEYGSLLQNLFAREGIAFLDVIDIAIASVVPQATPDLARLARIVFRREPLIITPELDLGLTVAYNPPGDVGADRLVDAVAALQKYGPAPLIFIDFGTATTFNAINADNVYLGGAIWPGVAASWETLFSTAARLWSVEPVAPERVIGDSTTHALQSGMTFALASMVDGMVARFREEMGIGDCPVVATGGQAADLLASVKTCITHVDPILTLEGLRFVYERNRPA